LDILTQVIRLILTILSQQRGYTVHEEEPDYKAITEGIHSEEQDELHIHLEHVPMP
jgi:hypothetical protein